MTGRDASGRFAPGHKGFGRKGAGRGQRRSPATEFKPGHIPWHAGTGSMITCAGCRTEFYVSRSRAPRAKYCSRVCKDKYQKSDPWKNKAERKHSPETRAKMVAINRAKAVTGPAHPLWKGGARSERAAAMNRMAYRRWRQAVFERDDYTCQLCGVRGSYVHADHIVAWAEAEEGRYDVDNGRTLCFECHFEVTFGVRDRSRAMRWGVPKRLWGTSSVGGS